MPILICHGGPAACSGLSLDASATLVDDRIDLRFDLAGDVSSVLFPKPGGPPVRRDGLWQTTCFELFLRAPAGGAYAEFNLSPSGDWAAYAFDDYRSGMRDLEAPGAIAISSAAMDRAFTQSASVAAAPIIALLGRAPWRIGLSAIIEGRDGAKSYWALARPPGKPDFHHGACFALDLPAPDPL